MKALSSQPLAQFLQEAQCDSSVPAMKIEAGCEEFILCLLETKVDRVCFVSFFALFRFASHNRSNA